MELPSELVQNAVKKIVKEHGFVDHEISWTLATKKGDNFMGVLYQIKITGTSSTGKEETLSLFCKVPDESEAMRNDFQLNISFQREILMYAEVLPDFEKFQAEKGVKIVNLQYPKVYACNKNDFEEHIIMEDLRSQGFSLFDRRKPLDYDHVKLIFKELGKFHAISFALKDQQPEVIKKYEGRFPELVIRNPLVGGQKKWVETFLNSANLTVKYEGIYKEKWDYFYQNYIKLMNYILTGASAEPYAVINHGDIWTNNILFKYENGKPKELRFVDFQLSRYTSIAPDLCFIIFGCTDKAFRDKYYKTLLNDYYESLCIAVKELGSDPDKVFPRSAFEDQIQRFGLSGLGLGVLDMPMFASDPENAPTVESVLAEISGASKHNQNEYVKQRILDAVKDTVDLGYLSNNYDI